MPDALDPCHIAPIAGGLVAALVAGLSLGAPTPAAAQATTLMSVPSTACGGVTYTAGSPHPITGDAQGNLCIFGDLGTVTAVIAAGTTVGASQVAAWTLGLSAAPMVSTAATGFAFATGAHSVSTADWEYTGTLTAWALLIDGTAALTNGAAASPVYCHGMGPGPSGLSMVFPTPLSVTTGLVLELSTGTAPSACNTVATAAAATGLVGAQFK